MPQFTVRPPRTSRPAPGREWFGKGSDAFKRAFPALVAEIPCDQFWVCPLCLHAFGEDALEARFLTREHVPPRSVGGKRMTLTCGPCNWEGGTADSHAGKEAHLFGFAEGTLPEIKASLTTRSGTVPIRLSGVGNGLLMFGVPQATSESQHAAVFGDFDAASHGEKWREFSFSVGFSAFSQQRARVSWLRSACLAFFSLLGYRFVFRRELNDVRHLIREPEMDLPVPRVFRVIRVIASPPTLLRIDQPERFRGYAMLYGRNMVFLPRYNDHGLYDRLAADSEQIGAGPMRGEFSGLAYPWPKSGPVFFHDHAKPRRKLASRARVPAARPKRPNERWAMDFVSARLADGRWFRPLTVLDLYTRESLALVADRSLTGAKVAAVLTGVLHRRAGPQAITVDNGSEFVSRAMDAWAYAHDVRLDFIRPGKPVENAFIESFNGKLRDECLNSHVFATVAEAQVVLDVWREDYNVVRPQSALSDRTPIVGQSFIARRPILVRTGHFVNPCRGRLPPRPSIRVTESFIAWDRRWRENAREDSQWLYSSVTRAGTRRLLGTLS
jgi:hypothetical protein